MRFGEHTQIKKASEFYNEFWCLQRERDDLIKRLKINHQKLLELSKKEENLNNQNQNKENEVSKSG